MSTAILISNAHGVVLCADSAITAMNSHGQIGTVDGGAKKLTGLALPHRLGIIHVGRMSLGGVPIDTLLNGWSQSLPPIRMADLRDYLESLTTYLKEIVPGLANEREWAERYLLDWITDLHSCRKKLEGENVTSNDDVRNHFMEQISSLSEVEDDEDKEFVDIVFRNLGRDSAENILLGHAHSILGINDLPTSIEDAVDRVFADLLETEVIDVVYEWAQKKLGRMYPNGSNTKLVIAGYAGEEILPSAIEVNLKGFAFGRLFLTERSLRLNRKPAHAFIQSLGNSQTIHSFLRQIHVSYQTLEEVVRDCAAEWGHSPVNLDEDENSSGDVSDLSNLEEFGKVIVDSYNLKRWGSHSQVTQFLNSCNLVQLARLAPRLVLLESLAFELKGEPLYTNADLTVATVSLDKGFVLLEGSEK